MMSYKFLFSILSTFITLSLSASIHDFETEFNIKIILEDTFQSSFEKVSYEVIKDQNRISFYIDSILTKEFRKYPENYFNHIELKQIVLCRNLFVTEQKRAAMPDPVKNTLVFSIESSFEIQYLIHILHHEMHHITEYALWQDMFYKWRKWERKNTKDFEYGTGGSRAYEDENKLVNWYAINNPVKGFTNLYSTLGQEEDRCEIVALMMTDSEKHLLKEFIKSDKNLKRKVNLTLRILSKISKEKVKYWKSKLEE